jgi:quercetin dioxygenase-like cupin family protein
MNASSRRDLYIALRALVGAGRATAQTAPQLAQEKSGQPTLSDSKVLSPDRLPATTNANGGKKWNILQGVLATGEAVALHESLQPAGIAPSPAHSIQHSELILVQQGTLLFEYDGRSEKVAEGGVIFVAFRTRHSARNVGDGPAKYLVVAIGGDSR